jgi:hypothetical protein
VLFYDGTTLLETQMLNAGVATYSTSALTVGAHSITAAYSGDSNFTSITSSAVTDVVEDFTFAVQNGGSVTASAGGQAVYSFSLAPPSGDTFPRAINLTVSGLPAGASAAFSPASVSAGSGATNVTLTVTLSNSAAMQSSHHPFGSSALPVALGLILLPFIGAPRRFSRHSVRTVCLAVLLIGSFAMAAALSGCSSGSGGSGGNNSTPQAQAYTLTVAAASGLLSHSTTVSLTVK